MKWQIFAAAAVFAMGLHADDVVVSFYRDVAPADMQRILFAAGLERLEHPDLLPWQALASGRQSEIDSAATSPDVERVFPASPELVSRTPLHGCADALMDAGPFAQFVATIGQGWDGPGQGEISLTYSYRHNTDQHPPEVVLDLIERALDEWRKYADLRIERIDEPGAERSIDISFERGAHGDNADFDGPGRTLAHTFYPTTGEPYAGDVHLDDDDTWSTDRLYAVLLHEIGHALGLGHSNRPGAVMYPYYSRLTELQEEDIKALQRLYAFSAAPSED